MPGWKSVTYQQTRSGRRRPTCPSTGPVADATSPRTISSEVGVIRHLLKSVWRPQASILRVSLAASTTKAEAVQPTNGDAIAPSSSQCLENNSWRRVHAAVAILHDREQQKSASPLEVLVGVLLQQLLSRAGGGQSVVANDPPAVKVAALGIGRLDSLESQQQFAFYLVLVEALRHSGVQVAVGSPSYFDPAADPEVDGAVVGRFGVAFETANTSGALDPVPAPVLIELQFMPKCPRELYHNALTSLHLRRQTTTQGTAGGVRPSLVVVGNDLAAFPDSAVYATVGAKKPIALRAIDICLPFLKRVPLWPADLGKGVPVGLDGLTAFVAAPSEIDGAAMDAAWDAAEKRFGRGQLAQAGADLLVHSTPVPTRPGDDAAPSL